MSVRKTLIVSALVVMLTSCKKDDIRPIIEHDTKEIEVDSSKTIGMNKVNNIVDKLSKSKPISEKPKIEKALSKKLMRFKKFLKSKFKKSN